MIMLSSCYDEQKALTAARVGASRLLQAPVVCDGAKDAGFVCYDLQRGVVWCSSDGVCEVTSPPATTVVVIPLMVPVPFLTPRTTSPAEAPIPDGITAHH
jgi:hypothetical protein